ncbi:hypothetical protein Syun_029787 [Stephania yunnanensis]|uniref:Uncharacterized protein n=1 Tax=Stephania yunnanensis TaxID=152371 RepID=A0AAP0E988_9MAGN
MFTTTDPSRSSLDTSNSSLHSLDLWDMDTESNQEGTTEFVKEKNHKFKKMRDDQKIIHMMSRKGYAQLKHEMSSYHGNNFPKCNVGEDTKPTIDEVTCHWLRNNCRSSPSPACSLTALHPIKRRNHPKSPMRKSPITGSSPLVVHGFSVWCLMVPFITSSPYWALRLAKHGVKYGKLSGNQVLFGVLTPIHSFDSNSYNCRELNGLVQPIYIHYLTSTYRISNSSPALYFSLLHVEMDGTNGKTYYLWLKWFDSDQDFGLPHFVFTCSTPLLPQGISQTHFSLSPSDVVCEINTSKQSRRLNLVEFVHTSLGQSLELVIYASSIQLTIGLNVVIDLFFARCATRWIYTHHLKRMHGEPLSMQEFNTNLYARNSKYRELNKRDLEPNLSNIQGFKLRLKMDLMRLVIRDNERPNLRIWRTRLETNGDPQNRSRILGQKVRIYGNFKFSRHGRRIRHKSQISPHSVDFGSKP